MKVKVELKETSQAITHENVKNAYTKGPLYCVYIGEEVIKYPVRNIWRVTETYKDK